MAITFSLISGTTMLVLVRLDEDERGWRYECVPIGREPTYQSIEAWATPFEAYEAATKHLWPQVERSQTGEASNEEV